MQTLAGILAKIHSVAEVYIGKHIVYTGEDHGDGYVNYRALGKDENLPLLRKVTSFLIDEIVRRASLNTEQPIWVVGPETLGAKMAEQAFHAKDTMLINTAFFKKAENKTFRFKPSEALLRAYKPQIVWVDDLLNASSTWKATIPLLEVHNLSVSAIGVIGDRSGLSPRMLGVRHVVSLEQFSLKRYAPADCPLCQEKIPILRKPGHGHEFEKAHPDYKGGFIDL